MSHEYRVTIAVPLSGTDRAQSAIKAKIGPLLDKFEADLKAMDLAPVVADSTVRLGRGKKDEQIQQARAQDMLKAQADIEAAFQRNRAAE